MLIKMSSCVHLVLDRSAEKFQCIWVLCHEALQVSRPIVEVLVDTCKEFEVEHELHVAEALSGLGLFGLLGFVHERLRIRLVL